jgi:hypothetical protein
VSTKATQKPQEAALTFTSGVTILLTQRSKRRKVSLAPSLRSSDVRRSIEARTPYSLRPTA